MNKLIAPIGLVLGAAVWFLLFVILGVGLGTSFIAGGCTLAACVFAAGLGFVDAPLTAAGLLLGIATFVIMRVVLSVPIWVDVVSGLGVIGLYDIANAGLGRAGLALRTKKPATQQNQPAPVGTPGWSNGHNREPVGAR